MKPKYYLRQGTTFIKPWVEKSKVVGGRKTFPLLETITIFTNPSTWAGYDTWSIFKRSLRTHSALLFTHSWNENIGFIPFPRVLVLCEMQSISSRIWTRVTVSISYDDNHYTMSTSILETITEVFNWLSCFIMTCCMPSTVSEWILIFWNRKQSQIFKPKKQGNCCISLIFFFDETMFTESMSRKYWDLFLLYFFWLATLIENQWLILIHHQSLLLIKSWSDWSTVYKSSKNALYH